MGRTNRAFRYNSVVFSTSQANDYVALIVSPGYLNGDSLTLTNGSSNFGSRYGDSHSTLLSQYDIEPDSEFEPLSTPDLDLQEIDRLAERLRSNISSLTRLENVDCVRAYENFLTDFLNVVLVTDNQSYALANANGFEGPLLAAYEYHPAPNHSLSEPQSILQLYWFCDYPGGCDVKLLFEMTDFWSFTLAAGDGSRTNQTVKISHCLAEPVQPQCTVEILLPVLIVVIICNAFKAIAFTALLAKRGFTPLVILGDAIVSFMSDPDPTALSSGPLSSQTVRKVYMVDPFRFSVQHQRKHWQQDRPARRVTPWHGERRTWASAVGRRRWITTIFG